MSKSLEQLRELHPGKWVLIRLDAPDAETGIVLAADEKPEVVGRELENYARTKTSRVCPPYVTYAIPEGEELPYFAL